jgi:hypothetical protein
VTIFKNKIWTLVILVIVMLSIFPASVFASTGWFDDGGRITQNGLTGARATISYDNPWVGYSDSSVWPMVAVGPNYVQSGYAKYAGQSGVHYFAEWTNGAYDSAYDMSGTHLYGVVLLGSYWTMYVDGTYLAQISTSNIGFTTGYDAQYYAETHDSRDYSTGDNNNKVRFSQVQYTVGSGWTNSPIGSWTQSLATSGLSHASYPSSNYFDIWDTRAY